MHSGFFSFPQNERSLHSPGSFFSDIQIVIIQFNTDAFTVEFLCDDAHCARAIKRIQHNIAFFTAGKNTWPDQRAGKYRKMGLGTRFGIY